jgi:ribosomal protein S18 acetylase RimI-like enzyme
VIAYRDAAPDDIDDLVALVVASLDTYRDWLPVTWKAPDPARHAAHWRRQLRARIVDPLAHGIVALDSDRGVIVGFIGFTQARDADNVAIVGIGHVWALFIAPACWRRGAATALLHAAQDRLRNRGCTGVILSTPVGAPACRFYEAHGFAVDGRRAHYEPGDLELVGYAKAL